MEENKYTTVGLGDFKKYMKELVKYCAGKKTMMPILKCVAISLTKDDQVMVATDLEKYKKLEVKANVVEDVKFCVPAKTLYDLLNTLTDKTIILSVVEGDMLDCAFRETSYKFEGLMIASESDDNITILKGFPIDEFPMNPRIEEEE